MSWKEKLGIEQPIKDSEVMEYLKDAGFEMGLMNPKYYNEESMVSEIKGIRNPCMVLSTKNEQSGEYITIYINDAEAYMEKEDYSYCGSDYEELVEELTMQNIDRILDELL